MSSQVSAYQTIGQLHALLAEFFDLVECAADFSNGNTHNGADEGSVRGWEMVNALRRRAYELGVDLGPISWTRAGAKPSTKEPDLKTAQAIAHLVSQQGEPLHYLSALKLLYLADRIALKELGQPISNGEFISTHYGAIAGESTLRGDNDWFGVHTIHLHIIQRNEPGDGELSEAECKILYQVFIKYSHLNPYDTEGWMQDCPEWRPYANKPGAEIPLVEILNHLNLGQADIQEIMQRSGVKEEPELQF